MLFDFKITGVKELQSQLKDFSERRVNAVVATALTRTAVQVRDKLKATMPLVFNAPTPYTVRQLKYVAATANRHVAAVGFNVAAITDARGAVLRYQDLGPNSTPAGKYMQYQIDGGSRHQKRFEKALQMVGVLPVGWLAVPGARAKVDANGNQSIGEIRQILSWFDAAEFVAGSRQNMRGAGRDKRKQGTRRKAGFEYFVSPVGEVRSFTRASGVRGTHKMQPGIYRRTMYAMGSRIEPIVIFVRRATYRTRSDFYGIAKAEGDRLLQGEIDKAIRDSAARLSSKP